LVYDDTMKKIKNNFLTKKIIKVILENKVETLEIKGAKHLYKGTYKHAFEIDTNKHPIRSIVAKIMSKYKVEDISVIDPPIEEIIELIYNDTGKIL
jgi:ABC-2 type transport system ATP-binding protein